MANPGSTDNLMLVLDEAPNGLSGYSINMTIADPAVATITAVSYPSGATLSDTSTRISTECRIKASDLGEHVQGGATNITLANLTIQGLSGGSTAVTVTITMMADDDDVMLSPTIVPGTFTVT